MRILCFGDSNTWGQSPCDDSRLERRYPVVLQEILSEHTIIEEGLCGRSFDSVNHPKWYTQGLPYFTPCIHSHDPLDVIVIMLGTNDTKAKYKKNAQDIFFDSQKYLQTIDNEKHDLEKVPAVIFVSPPLLGDEIEQLRLTMFRGANESLTMLFDLYTKAGLNVVDCRDVQTGADNVHLTEESHEIIAKRVASAILTLGVEPKHS